MLRSVSSRIEIVGMKAQKVQTIGDFAPFKQIDDLSVIYQQITDWQANWIQNTRIA
jgi:hypothetical protein